MDKTGACTVIAAIATVAQLAPGTPLLAIALAVENMPGPHSTRPGDVVRALNGKMVDITNTDAEGRLILGDAMTYAEQLGATHIVDVATLTGAVARALGHLVTGAFGRPQDFYDDVMAAADRAGERYWQLPLVDDYVPGDGELVRRPAELRVGRGVAREERAVPARVRDQAVGPPRHRRDRVLPQGHAVRASRRHGRVARDARRAGAGGRCARLTDRASRWRGPQMEVALPPIDWLAGLLTGAGAVFGFAADRLSTRWPEHDEEHPPGRSIDWRTLAVVLVGASAFGLLTIRFAGDPLATLLFGAWFVTLVVGLAMDFDQRILLGLADVAGHPGRPALRDQRREPARRHGGGPAVDRGHRHPGDPVPAVDPVRGGRLRPRRREAAGRRGA